MILRLIWAAFDTIQYLLSKNFINVFVYKSVNCYLLYWKLKLVVFFWQMKKEENIHTSKALYRLYTGFLNLKIQYFQQQKIHWSFVVLLSKIENKFMLSLIYFSNVTSYLILLEFQFKKSILLCQIAIKSK